MDKCLEYLKSLSIKTTKKVYRNLPVSELVEKSLEKNMGVLAETGAFVVNTGKYTGRSPKDRFIVMQESIKDKINWGDVNLPIKEEIFDNLYNKVTEYLSNKELYVFDGFAGAMEEYRLPIRIVNELPSSALCCNQLFIRPKKEILNNHQPEFTVIVAPKFKCRGKEDGVNSEAFILINFDKRIILIGGTEYGGEIKKSVFSIMNYLMPHRKVFPMHCSANIGKDGNTAIFFGLSGTGKTTLSADSERKLIGDDEHGWCDKGVFNFEGGCYAKTIRLSRENEKEIYEALRFGTLLENVILDDNKIPDFDDASLTENTRGAYPIDYIPNAELSGIGGQPNTIVFLTADAFGVMPPISKLSREAAMYHFMSGYTSKLAGTERGITEPQATFSACFGEPFMLMSPYVYAKLLGERIDKYNTDVYLVNTGWSGGVYGVGSRIKLSYTRAMVKAALEGKLSNAKCEKHPVFNVEVPQEVPGVPSDILNPRSTWADQDEYDKKAKELANKFNTNFKRYDDVPDEIRNAGPIAI
jgi:phosphoenolpyruvate carboxykinase (ATP)